MHELNNYSIIPFGNLVPIEKRFSVNEPVVRFYELMKKLKLSSYLKSSNVYERRGRKKIRRQNILMAIIFAFSMNIRSTRDILEACKYDTRLIALLGGVEIKSHNTIAHMINEIKDIDKLLKDINILIFSEDKEVNMDEVYIDGTKIEAYANKYTFVWKNAILKNQIKLNAKINSIINDINNLFRLYNFDIIEKKEKYDSQILLSLLLNLKKIMENNNIELVKGKGKRKTDIQKLFNYIDEYTSKMQEYEMHLSIIGKNRNSYSKTDHDATFMRMKEDYMLNGQLKPAYNLQIGICNGYTVVLNLFQDKTDFATFIPLLKQYKDLYGKYPKYPVADAGYGNYENYSFCEKNNIELYQKYTMYSYEKTPTIKKNKFSKDKFKFIDDKVYCPNKKEMEFVHYQNDFTFEGAQPTKVYKSNHCLKCKFRKQCTKSTTGRSIQINEDFERLKNIAKTNLDSENGIRLRVNRSIQVEGFFAILKQDSKYNTLYRRSMEKAKLELSLIAIGQNIKRYLYWSSIKYEIKNAEK